MPPDVRAAIETLLGASVASASNCPGGYSPGFASRLVPAGGERVFVKAIDGKRWPMNADWHRTEARTTQALPPGVPAPRLLGSAEQNGWVALAFEDVDGRELIQPWRVDELERVLDALTDLAGALTPSPIQAPSDHPRLGGWLAIARDTGLSAQLADADPWAADDVERLVALEADGLRAARGDTLVHFDVFAHNILLTPETVYFVDWPHARLGAPFVDLIQLLASVPTEGIDADEIVARHPLTSRVDPHAITGVLAGYAGFCMHGALQTAPPGMEAVRDAKVVLARSALRWLVRRAG